VDMMENDVVGPLYKTILHRAVNAKFIEKYIMGPQAMSVSRVNLAVSIFTIVIWVALLVQPLPPFRRNDGVSWRYCAIGGITLFFLIVMRFGAKTHLGSHEHVVTKRKTRIVGTTN
jgi:hypothetical protein